MIKTIEEENIDEVEVLEMIAHLIPELDSLTEESTDPTFGFDPLIHG